MGLLRILAELWATRLEDDGSNLKGAIEHTEKKLRETPEGCQQLDKFYSEALPEMMVKKGKE